MISNAHTPMYFAAYPLKPAVVPCQNELIDHFALQQRDVKIRHGEQQVADDGHASAARGAGGRICQSRFHGASEKAARFSSFFMAHSASSSPSADCIRAVCANTPPCSSSSSGVPRSMICPSLSTMI